MTKLSKILLIALIVVFTACSDDNSPVNPNTKTITEEIDRLCDSILQNSKAPGMIVGVWLPQSNFKYLKAHGYDDPYLKTPINVNSFFRIGSNTKSYIVTMVLQLVDEGKLRLDDKLSEFYPEFPRADEVSIHNLMNMTSGIFNYSEEKNFFEDMDFNNPHPFTNEELINKAAKHPYLFDPGTAWSYSNTNTIFLGMILETLTGKSIVENLNSRIFRKYGFSKTTFVMDHRMPANSMNGWTYLRKDSLVKATEATDMTWGGAAAAMISNVYEFRKWVELLCGGSMLSDSLYQKQFSGYVVPMPSLDYKYGYGVFSEFDNGYWGHTGTIPGYNTLMMHNKTTKATIVAVYNTNTNDVNKLYYRILEVLKRY